MDRSPPPGPASRLLRGAFTLPLLIFIALATRAASAHDTWFDIRSRDGRSVVMALGTGNRYPVQEYAVGAEHLRRQGCRQGGRAAPLEALRASDTALLLRTDDASAGEPLSCWAQTEPLDIELPPDKVQVYLREINAAQSVRAAWAGMQARGVPWRERYTKHARVELAASRPAGVAPSRGAAPSGMGLDVLLESGLQPLRAGDTLEFRVLRDGSPLPDFAVELRGDRLPVGLWLKTDGDGLAKVRAPLPGRWVLRGTDLRPSAATPDLWESRFVTLVFEVGVARTDEPAAAEAASR